MDIKEYIALILLLLPITGCKTPAKITEVPVKTEIIVHERLIPVSLPNDSLMLSAFFECDSNYNVLLRAYNEEKSKNIASSFGFGNNLFNYKAITVRDTMFIVGKDSFIYRDIPLKIPVPYEVNKVKGWQYFLIWCGVIAIAAFLILIVLRLVKRK